MTLILNFALWVLGLFGFGKPDPQKTGEQLRAGKDAEEVLREVAVQKLGADAPIPDSVRKSSYRD